MTRLAHSLFLLTRHNAAMRSGDHAKAAEIRERLDSEETASHHATPRFAMDDKADILPCDAVTDRDALLGLTGGSAIPNVTYVFRGETGAAVVDSALLAILRHLVGHVVGVCSLEDVMWVHACWVVAVVQSERHRPPPVMHKECYAMSRPTALLAAYPSASPHHAVPRRRPGSGPDMTGAKLRRVRRNGAVGINSRKESSPYLGGSDSRRHSAPLPECIDVSIPIVHELTPRGPAPRAFAAPRGALDHTISSRNSARTRDPLALVSGSVQFGSRLGESSGGPGLCATDTRAEGRAFLLNRGAKACRDWGDRVSVVTPRSISPGGPAACCGRVPFREGGTGRRRSA